MPGFIGTIGNNTKIKFNKEIRKHLIQDTLEGENYVFERRTIKKFLHDKIFVDRYDLLIITEGVILNIKDLLLKYKAKNLEECIVSMYEIVGETFFKEFRGGFSGVLYDKRKDIGFIYTDHIGDKQIFHTIINDGILVGTEIGFMVETCKINNIPITLNKTGAYLALTHGFVIEDHTLVAEVKKLTAGHYLRFDKNGLEEIQYHRFTNKPNLDITLEEAIEEIDRLFRKAVQLQFEKDKEYGYKHLTGLSGGLDSRMTVWVAHQMGYTEQLNTTFSQSNYLDFSIAQQIATDLQHDFLFKTLDHGNFIKDLDNITKITYGSTCFFGLAHGKSLYDMLNFEPYGLVHTGMIGDAIIGTFFRKPSYDGEIKLGIGAYSLEIIERLSDYKFKYEYENEEIFCLYTRAFTGANQGMVEFQEHTESVSPFCDVDFIEFCYSLPVLWRYNHKIYFDWIFKKYPGSANYIWEKKKKKITPIVNIEPKFMTVFGFKIPSIDDKDFSPWLKGSILRRLGLRKKGAKAKTEYIPYSYSMNPIDFWYNNNESLRLFMSNYWLKNSHLIEDKELLSDMNHLYTNCVTLDKLQVLSVLSTIKTIKI